MLEAKLLAGSSGYDVVVPTSQFLQRQIGAGVYQPLDKAKLPNLANMDPELMERAAAYDPGNEHAIDLHVGHHRHRLQRQGGRGAARRRGAGRQLGAGVRPAVRREARRLRHHPARFVRPTSCRARSPISGSTRRATEGEDFEKAAALLEAVRPYIRYFHSSQYISDLANGEVCVSVGFSGDIFIAADRAVQAGNGIEIAYSVPKEGAQQWFDMTAIPADAPNPEAAHAFINFVMDPQITADITNYVWYANANAASWPLVDPEIIGDPAIYPPAEVRAKLFPTVPHDARTDRLMTRLWTG